MNASDAKKTPYDYTSAIIAYEQGELDHDETVELFQYLVDTQLAFRLQGHYGRTAVALYKAGFITDEDGEYFE